MDSAPSMSQPAPVGVPGTPPQHCSTKPCTICNSFEGRPDYYNLISYPTWDDIVESARTCVCCDVIVRGCRGWLDEDGKQDWTPTSLTLDFRYPWTRGKLVESCSNNMVAYRGYVNVNETHGSHYICMKFVSNTIFLRIYATEAMPETWRYFKWSYRITGFTGSAAAFKKAENWLGNCVENHALCSSEHDQTLPTMLFDLQSSDDEGIIRLVETMGEVRRYAALSHCWGASAQFTTTKATLVERKDRISLIQLTKTFREAVQVTRALAIRYLWIDSLCIVQDDHDDWAREASRMSTVYHNAFITISATASKSGDEGLFRKCPEFEVQVCSKDGKEPAFIIHKERKHLDGMEFRGLRDGLPLNERAWGLQERLLSPRVLHFTQTEMVFECLTEHLCECSGVRDVSWSSHIKAPKTYLRTGVSDLDSLRIWKRIVSQYSHRKLTYPKDKLVAIAGLAKMFAKPGDRYLAGLWESALNDQLEWIVMRGLAHKIKPKPAWRVPSWSWAAVDDPISFSDVSDDLKSSAFPGHHAASADILHCKVVPKSTDEYGELISGRLRLLGRCTSVAWVVRPEHHSLSNRVVFSSGYEYGFWLDASIAGAALPGTLAKDCDIVCVLLRAMPSLRTSLVLRRLKLGKDIFERIGLLVERVGDDEVLEDTDILFPSEKAVVEIL